MSKTRWLNMMLCLCAALVAISPPAYATIITFAGNDPGANDNDPHPNSDVAAAAFDAAVSGKTIFTFEGSPLGPFLNLNLGSGVSISGDPIFNNASILNTPIASPDALFGYNTTLGGSQWVSLLSNTLTFTFANPVDAFGAYLTGVQFTGETITFNDGSSQTLTIPNPGSGAQFFGFTDFGKSIASLTINAQFSVSQGDVVGVDDVRIGTAGVSEPATLALLGLGLAGLGFSRRKRT